MTSRSRCKPYDASVGRAGRGVGVALGAAAIAFNIIASMWLTGAATAAPTTLPKVLGQRGVICAPSGMMVVDRGGWPLANKGPASDRESRFLFCSPLTLERLGATAQKASAQREARRAATPEFGGAKPAGLFHPSGLWPRGPPTT
jgi:hypothetical protein